MAKMMISYDGWCRAARQGCLPTGNYGSASRPDPTILWPYSCQNQPSSGPTHARPNPTHPTIVWQYSYPTHARPNQLAIPYSQDHGTS